MKTLMIANIFGLAGLIFNFLSSQMNKKEKILLCNGLCNLMLIIQYIILGAYTGSVSCLIAVIRNIVFYFYKDKIPLYVLIIYILAIIISNMFLITNFISFIPLITTLTYGILLYQKNIKLLKGGTIVVDAIAILFDAYNKAYISMINCIFSTLGGIIGYVRYINQMDKESEKKLLNK